MLPQYSSCTFYKPLILSAIDIQELPYRFWYEDTALKSFLVLVSHALLREAFLATCRNVWCDIWPRLHIILLVTSFPRRWRHNKQTLSGLSITSGTAVMIEILPTLHIAAAAYTTKTYSKSLTPQASLLQELGFSTSNPDKRAAVVGVECLVHITFSMQERQELCNRYRKTVYTFKRRELYSNVRHLLGVYLVHVLKDVRHR